MKLITIILSLYIFMLSATPCVDVEPESAAHSIPAQAAEKDNHAHDKNNDLCSPFCICSCCGQVTLSYYPVFTYSFTKQFKEIKTVDSIYTSAIYYNFYGSIWQPPQLV